MHGPVVVKFPYRLEIMQIFVTVIAAAKLSVVVIRLKQKFSYSFFTNVRKFQWLEGQN